MNGDTTSASAIRARDLSSSTSRRATTSCAPSTRPRRYFSSQAWSSRNASLILSSLQIKPDIPAPLFICKRRNLARLDFATATPEDIGVGDADVGLLQMLINGG